MYGTSIALLMVVRSGQAGGIKGAEASLTDETLATMSPFALVRRGVGWWSCGDSNPGPSHCEGVPSPIDYWCMRCMSCELTARAPRCRPRGAPGGHANWCQVCGVHPEDFSGCPPHAAFEATCQLTDGRAWSPKWFEDRTFCSVGNPRSLQVEPSPTDTSMACVQRHNARRAVLYADERSSENTGRKLEPAS
jgi:hypothetical protein